jgi:hypothetical protein
MGRAGEGPKNAGRERFLGVAREVFEGGNGELKTNVLNPAPPSTLELHHHHV